MTSKTNFGRPTSFSKPAAPNVHFGPGAERAGRKPSSIKTNPLEGRASTSHAAKPSNNFPKPKQPRESKEKTVPPLSSRTEYMRSIPRPQTAVPGPRKSETNGAANGSNGHPSLNGHKDHKPGQNGLNSSSSVPQPSLDSTNQKKSFETPKKPEAAASSAHTASASFAFEKEPVEETSESDGPEFMETLPTTLQYESYFNEKEWRVDFAFRTRSGLILSKNTRASFSEGSSTCALCFEPVKTERHPVYGELVKIVCTILLNPTNKGCAVSGKTEFFYLNDCEVNTLRSESNNHDIIFPKSDYHFFLHGKPKVDELAGQHYLLAFPCAATKEV